VRTLLLIFSFLILSQAIHAQSFGALFWGRDAILPTVDAGIQAGINTSLLTNSCASTWRPSFDGGAYLTYRFHPHWQWTTLVSFSGKGARNVDTRAGYFPLPGDTLQDLKLSRRLSYIELIPGIQYRFTNGFVIGMGPVFSFLTAASDLYTASWDGTKTELRYNIYDKMNAMDVGIMAEVQYGLASGNGLFFTLRFTQGLVPVYTTPCNSKVYNTLVYLGIGIPIRAGKTLQPVNQ